MTLILVAVPSRTKVEHYRQLKKDLDELVGRINSKHGTLGWMPVWYIYNFLNFQELAALYILSDVGLVTPVRDGMNLIAKEFIAAKTDGKGVLILSEMAGAAKELSEALIVNPNNIERVVDSIYQALTMPVKIQLAVIGTAVVHGAPMRIYFNTVIVLHLIVTCKVHLYAILEHSIALFREIGEYE